MGFYRDVNCKTVICFICRPQFFRCETGQFAEAWCSTRTMLAGWKVQKFKCLSLSFFIVDNNLLFNQKCTHNSGYTHRMGEGCNQHHHHHHYHHHNHHHHHHRNSRDNIYILILFARLGIKIERGAVAAIAVDSSAAKNGLLVGHHIIGTE